MAKRGAWHLNGRAWGLLACGMLAFVWLVPAARQLSVPAVTHADVATLYPMAPARVAEVSVGSGQRVAAGAPLVRLESPEIASRAERARLRAAGLAEELARTPANAIQRERRHVLEEQLGEALADEAGAREELVHLDIRAPQAGTVRDMPADLLPGRWVGPRQALLRVVSEEAPGIDAYVDEQMLQAVEIGQSVRFYPDHPDWPVLHGTVVGIDSAAGRNVSPLLASTHGGELAATLTPRGNLVAHEALYRLRIRLLPDEPGVPMVLRGTVRIESGWHALGAGGLARMLSVLVRESGF